MMKVLVDKLPNSKKDCLFSQVISENQDEKACLVCKFLSRKYKNDVFCKLEHGCPFLITKDQIGNMW